MINCFLRLSLIGAIFIFLLGAETSSALAAYVTSVSGDGLIQFESGEKVRLAGVSLPSESVKVLDILLSKQDVEVEVISKQGPELPGFISEAYLYINVKETTVPIAPNQQPYFSRRMVNLMLLDMGAAKVNNPSEEVRNSFENSQADAKEKGLGIWSYQDFSQIK